MDRMDDQVARAGHDRVLSLIVCAAAGKCSESVNSVAARSGRRSFRKAGRSSAISLGYPCLAASPVNHALESIRDNSRFLTRASAPA